MKKQMLVLVAIATVMLAIGCVSSGSDNAASKNTAAPSADSTPSASSAQSTASANSNQAGDSDTEWYLYVTKYTAIITADVNDYSKALDSSDYASLETSGQKIIDDTQKAIDENSKYTVSSQPQNAQKEWVAALQDYNSAGKYIVSAAKAGQAGNDNTEDMQQVTTLMASGADHFNKASDAM